MSISEGNENNGFSVIVPVYNEEHSVAESVTKLKEFMTDFPYEYEIIVVNDGSTDKSQDILKDIEGIKLINHHTNMGYGSSLKSGIKNSKYDWVIFYDGDGQHPVEPILKMAELSSDYDAVIGIRSSESFQSIFRVFGKKILWGIMNIFLPVKVKDLNCGFRAFKKNILKKYLHLMPDGYSMSMTSLVVFLIRKYNVYFLEIESGRRLGKSKVSILDAIRSLILIIRIIMLFFPLKLFVPVGSLLMIYGLVLKCLRSFVVAPMPAGVPMIFFATGFITIILGFIADQIGHMRREKFENEE